MRFLVIVALCLLASSCPTTGGSPLQNVEGFAFVTTAAGDPVFAASVRGDVQKGCIVYGAQGDVGLRDAMSKFRFTLPLEDLQVGEMRYWDKGAGVRETVPIGTAVPAWVLELWTPQEADALGLVAP